LEDLSASAGAAFSELPFAKANDPIARISTASNKTLNAFFIIYLRVAQYGNKNQIKIEICFYFQLFFILEHAFLSLSN